MLILVWIIETTFLKLYYSKYQIESVTALASAIVDVNLYDKQNEESVENLAYKHNVCISIYSEYGDIKNFNTKMRGCNLNDSNVLNIIYRFFNSTKSNLSLKINHSGHNDGYLYALKNGSTDIFIYAPLYDNVIINNMLHGQLKYITLLCIIISSALAIFISKLITNPIRIITAKARNIGKENYNNIYKDTGIKEIDELNETLNLVQEELNKVKIYQRDLLANVSHDLKTPLTMIRAYAEKIRDISYKEKEKMDSDLSIIIDETNRLSLLVNDIVEMSSLNAENNNLYIEEYDLVVEIKNILTRYEIIREKENYNFVVNLPSKAVVKADKQKINQVIYNLINNALNYTGDDKTIYIDLVINNKKTILKIRDTGKGIKPKDLKNIWTKYYKNDKNHKRNVISSGIGLSIVKEILEKHGFNYGVNSEINKGSEFYFEINNKTLTFFNENI